MTTDKHFSIQTGLTKELEILLISLAIWQYEFAQLKVMFGIKGIFLDYERLISEIHRYWKEKINENIDKCKDMKLYVQVNSYIKYFVS